VSRLWPERLRIALSPAEIAVGDRTIDCDPGFGNEPWQGAVAALRSFEIKRPCKCTVVLSNHFVRYAVVPWSDALGTAAEEDAYIRHHFAKIHGERAKSWVLRASAGGGADRLASAIDAALLEEIRASFPKGGKARLVSVQPQLMAAINQWRKAIPPGGAWLVLADSDRACVALHSGGGWRSVQVGKGGWLGLLERERFRLNGGIEGGFPELVLLAGAAAPSEPSGGWKFRELAA
jgi:hypothetical protein